MTTNPLQFELEIDKFGRILLPKKLREAMRLGVGSKLQSELKDGALHLHSQDAPPTLQTSADGWPILQLAAPLPKNFNPTQDLANDRSAEDLAAWH